MVVITKSRFLEGLWCPKLFWYQMNDRGMIPSRPPEAMANMEEGIMIGEIARERFPGGILIDSAFEEALIRTHDALQERKPLFEASIQHEYAYCKVDVLLPTHDGMWDLIEVKKSASVKPEHIDDLGFQHHTLTHAGLAIRRACVMHIDTSYIRQGRVDARKLFAITDVTDDVIHRAQRIPDDLQSLLNLAKGPRPAHEVLHVCNHPYGCPCEGLDTGPAPEHSVLELCRDRVLGRELVAKGVYAIVDVPQNQLSPKQIIQQRAIAEGKPIVDAAPINAWLAQLRYPLHFLDFETITGAIPPFDGTRPYSNIPFQASIHTLASPGAALQHHEFLGDGTDPRMGIVDALRVMGDEGTILAYNATFERGRIKELLQAYPAEAWLSGLLERIRDLEEPFRNFWYYHPAQHGRTSIKLVLPAMDGLSYDDLEVKDGLTASAMYARLTEMDPPERERSRTALFRYCERDTLAMVRVLGALERACRISQDGSL